MADERSITGDTLRRYRRVTVMGLGMFGGGAGAARYFVGLGAEVTVTDTADAAALSRQVKTLDGLPVRFVLGRHRLEDFTGADLVVANQAVRPDNRHLAAARAAGVPVATETGLALSLNRSPWMAVTGSSGKSTTSALAAAMLMAHDPAALFGGNIGGDLITRVENRPADSPLIVELSSFQLTYLAHDFASGNVMPPLAAVVTNITPNHLDWHADLDEYAEAKRGLVRSQAPDGWTVLNNDDPVLRAWADETPSKVIHCAFADPGREYSCFVRDETVTLRLDGAVILKLPLSRFRLIGRHNVLNALEAVAAAYVMCRNRTAVEAGFSSFSGLPHRLERIDAVNGRTFVNDSKSTTPEAAVLALQAIAEPKVLIAGGYDKQSPFEKLGRAIQEMAAGLVLVGAAAGRIRDAAAAAAECRPPGMGELPVVEAGDDFSRAVAAAYAMTPPGGVVLLSPACASYGMFVNYEERGKRFRELAGTFQPPERGAGECSPNCNP